MLLLGVI